MHKLNQEGVTEALRKEVFGLDDINELPISYNIAWCDQKQLMKIIHSETNFMSLMCITLLITLFVFSRV